MPTTTIGFSAGKPPPPKAGGIASAISTALGVATGGDCGTGAGGFKKGNRCGAANKRNQSVLAATKAHTQARKQAVKAVKAHSKQNTPESAKAAQKAVADAAKAHRTLGEARKAHQGAKNAARRDKAMQARIERSKAEVHSLFAGRAADRIAALRAKAQDGSHDLAASLAGVRTASRGANKAELVTAANLLGVKHQAKTKGELVDHLTAHVIGDRKASGGKVDPASHTDHAPGHVGYLNTDLIQSDPTRFQYKAGHTASGSVGSLSGVTTYDHNLGGVLSVWKDPSNGKVFVVNGHNRLDKAKELGAGKVTVRFLDAHSAKEARSIGALQNIAEGNGTSTDAARFFRDTGLNAAALKTKGIAIGQKIGSDGIALSQLEDKAFRRVIDGTLSTEKGVIIGASGLADHQQRSVLDLLDRKGQKKGTEIKNSELRELLDDVKASPSVRKESRDLFGSNVEDESLALNRAKVSAFVKGKLATEKRLFGLVSRGKNADELARGGNQIDAAQSGQISQDASNALSVFDQHKRLSGPVSKVLNEANERIHAGEDPKKVQTDAYKRIFTAVREIIR